MKKAIKRIMASLLTVVMILTAIPLSGIDFGELFAPKVSAEYCYNLSNIPEQIPEYPESGQSYWVIFNEGYRSGRLEMSTFDVSGDFTDIKILWNKSLNIVSDGEVSDCYQYAYDTDKWEYIGDYHILSDYATKIFASNVDVYDTNGNLVVKASCYPNYNISSYNVGDIIEFGSYPQSEVTDETTISALNTKASSWQSYGYMSGKETDEYDGSAHESDYMKYCDVNHNGDWYRGVKFTTYRPNNTNYASTTSTDETYQAENGYYINTTYWFKYELLEWRVLDPTTGLVLCENIIDSQAYSNTLFHLSNGNNYKDANHTIYANNYYESSIRKWLNDDFFNTAFTDEEKSKINDKILRENRAYSSSCSQHDSESSTDAITLLTYDDITNTSYLFSNIGYDYDLNRRAHSTDYAKCQGCLSTSSCCTLNDEDTSNWWLRSASDFTDGACRVDVSGYADADWGVCSTCLGVRPALNLLSLDDIDDKTDYSLGEIIEFGSYPQSVVTDTSTISILDSISKSWKSYNYYSGTGSTDDGKMKASDYMKYADISCDGERYRAVTFSSYRPYYTSDNLDNDLSKTFQDDNNFYIGNVYYFKFEPLTWRVIDPKEGYVICNQVIDTQAYNNYVLKSCLGVESNAYYYGNSSQDYYSSDWKNSSLREWLNDDFYNTAFTENEKSRIGLSKNENKSKYSSNYNSRSTNDKIFLLSYWDVINSSYGFNADNSYFDESRQIKSTDYAKCQGCFTSTSTAGSCSWWLRSPYNSKFTTEVDCHGCADVCYSDAVNAIEGVVPAFKFNPASVVDIKENFSDRVINYKNSKGEEHTTEVSFNCNWFTKEKSNSYQHEIAQYCANLCLLGYRYDENDVKSYLESLDYDDDIDCDMNTSRDEVNYFIAKKNINVDDEVKTLVTVGTIGSYIEQWMSDFDPRGYERQKVSTTWENDDLHLGFVDARDFVYKKLINYMDSQNLSPEDVILLFTGHSRGAATANILAAEVIDSYETFGVPRNQIFAYTFATPNSVHKDVLYEKDCGLSDSNYGTSRQDSIYNNIYNIVNPEDFVTKVLPYDWGYRRYGVTYTLPSKTNEAKYYISKYYCFKEQMNTYFKNYTGKDYSPYNNGENPTWAIMRKFTSKVHSVSDFYENMYCYSYEKYMTPFKFFTGSLAKALAYMNDVTSKEFNEGVKEILKIFFGVNITSNPNLYQSLLNYFFRINVDLTYSIELEININFADAHSIETYCAFTQSLDEREMTRLKVGYRGSVNCPVDVEIYDKSTGEIVGRIKDNVVDDEIAEQENSVIMLVEGDSKIFWLPSNGEYEVKLIGNDKGTMDYTLAEMNSDTGETDRVNYFDVNITDGLTMTSDVGTDDFAIDDYSLEYENGDIIEPTEQIGESDSLRIDISVDGNGYATESMIVTSGDYVSLSATPNDGNHFAGWYNGDTLVSSEETYSLVAKEDVNLVAKFAPNKYVAKLMVDGEVYKEIQYTYGQKSISLPKVPEKEGYTGEWEAYSLVAGGVTINAVYTPIPSVKSVNINDISMNYKKSATITPTIEADAGASYTVKYDTSNAKVATVDDNGKVYAKGKGSATITCTVTDSNGNEVSDTCTVKVSYTWWQWIIKIVLFGWIWY